MDKCKELSKALHLLDIGNIAEKSHRIDMFTWLSLGVPMVFPFLWFLLSILHQCLFSTFWGFNTRSWTRRKFKCMLANMCLIGLFIGVPVMFWRRQAKENVFLNLISGRKWCETESLVLRQCVTQCMEIRNVRMEISRLRIVPLGKIFYPVYYTLLIAFVVLGYCLVRVGDFFILRDAFQQQQHVPGNMPLMFPDRVERVPIAFELRDVERQMDHVGSMDIDDGSCPICLENLWDRQACAPECGHTFHRACLEHWLRSARIPSCPICKVYISESTEDINSEVP